ncbi:caspase domain protein [Leptospira broomii serovar Hurstbridge str. 5399]|uniref:Caspase domain protein n=1 Tax=Leptospira broomii serovar Hurstbridge str. 5399 TaxID=1049789 RepID=T0F973_9LEPT|nr:caspase family protein [Leptospira broomii]EQA44461.1 caspase domain protein [Leptospira broomii serovar Hurstbridge str. 5399]
MKSLISVIGISLFLFSTDVFAQRRFGLIFGSNYKGNKAGIPELNLCEADATYLHDEIKRVGKFDDIRIILGKDVTKDNIQKEIKALASRAKSSDTVFLYFSGHGAFQRDANAKNGMRNYIICYDRPHLSDDELNDYLSDVKSPKTVFVFDCCFSGGIAKKGRATRGAAPVPIPQGSDGTVRQDPQDFYFQDKAIISSADDNQTAIEVGGNINHGIFTYTFGKALSTADLNQDHVVTALEAFFVSRDDTVAMAKKFDHDQVPQVSGNASGILLAGEKKPEPPPTVEPTKPPVTPTPTPDVDPPKVDPVVPVVTPQEPPVVPTNLKGDLVIKTTIIQDRAYGLSDLPPDIRLSTGKKRQGSRAVKVLIDDKEYETKISAESSVYWGAVKKMGKLVPGAIYTLTLKDLPAGVHKVTIQADDYPEVQKTQAVIPNKKNELEVIASMTGFGAIRGKVFYQTLDNPVLNQPIYMPTISSVSGIQKLNTDQNGNFWFTNLKPGEYEIKASFAEDLNLNNSNLVVKEGEVTAVDVILNVKLPSTKTKY